MNQHLDIASNRAVRNYSNSEMTRRLLWFFGQWLFRLSPRPCFAWRRAHLALFWSRNRQPGKYLSFEPNLLSLESPRRRVERAWRGRFNLQPGPHHDWPHGDDFPLRAFMRRHT